MINRRDVRTCSVCGSILDAGERCDCEKLQAKAERVGLTLRRRGDGGDDVFEMINRYGVKVGESNDETMLARYLDGLKVS